MDKILENNTLLKKAQDSFQTEVAAVDPDPTLDPTPVHVQLVQSRSSSRLPLSTTSMQLPSSIRTNPIIQSLRTSISTYLLTRTSFPCRLV